jgi:hypothetical protein
MAKLRPFATNCFNLAKPSRIFAFFYVFGWLSSRPLNPLHQAKELIKRNLLTAVRRGNDVRLTWAS